MPKDSKDEAMDFAESFTSQVNKRTPVAVLRQKKLWKLQQIKTKEETQKQQQNPSSTGSSAASQQQVAYNPFMAQKPANGNAFIQPRQFIPIGMKPKVVAEAVLKRKRKELSRKTQAKREATFARIISNAEGTDFKVAKLLLSANKHKLKHHY